MDCILFSDVFFIVDYQPKSSNTDLHEIIQDPRAAIEKGWSLLSYVGKAAVDFGRTVNETYVKPAAAQLADPQFRDHVRENVNHYVQSITQPRVNADRIPELVTHLFFLVQRLLCQLELYVFKPTDIHRRHER